jgi:hypothetical protein
MPSFALLIVHLFFLIEKLCKAFAVFSIKKSLKSHSQLLRTGWYVIIYLKSKIEREKDQKGKKEWESWPSAFCIA